MQAYPKISWVAFGRFYFFILTKVFVTLYLKLVVWFMNISHISYLYKNFYECLYPLHTYHLIYSLRFSVFLVNMWKPQDINFCFFLGKFQQAIKCTEFRNLWSINYCFELDLKSEPVLGSSSKLLDCILFHLYIFWFCRVSISITFFKFKSSLNIYFFSHFAIFRSVIFLPFHFESRHWLISFVVIRLSWLL